MKRGEFNFALLFGIIVGAAILILAVYGALNISDSQGYKLNTEIAKEMSILTNPMQAGFAEGKFGKMEFNSEVRINNFCVDEGFGENRISAASRKRVGEEWDLAGGSTSIHNKYIFSDKQEEGKEFYIFSKPFYFPFKVSDLIFVSSEDYCFKDVPEEIEDEVKGLNIKNIGFDNCSGISVCFDSSGCDVNVYGTCVSNCESKFDEGYVEKDGEVFYFVDSLMYGGIFSSKDVYDCNVNRLFYRVSSVAGVLSEKADYMSSRGCNTRLKADMIYLESVALNASSDEIIALNQVVKDIEDKNEKELCGLW